MSVEMSSKRKLDATPMSSAQKRAKTSEEPLENHQTAQRQCKPLFSRTPGQQCEPITVEDVCELLHYATLGKSYGTKKPSWCRLRGRRRVARVNVAVLEGLTQLHFYNYYSQFRNLRRKYSTRCTLVPSSGHLLSALLNSEVPDARFPPNPIQTASPTVEVLCHPIVQRFGLKKRGMSHILLTESEMIKCNFPVKGLRSCEGFVSSGADGPVTDSSPLFGLDCEMCLTHAGNELTRVALVDSRGRCVLDKLVKPYNPIINYFTSWCVLLQVFWYHPLDAGGCGHSSGRRPEDDSGPPARGRCPGRTLSGERPAGSEDDPPPRHRHLAALLQTVWTEVQTQTPSRGHPPGWVCVRREIQCEGRRGHDPCEDAQAALDLAQYFISNGPKKVVKTHLEELWGVCPVPQSPVNGTLNGSLNSSILSSLKFGHILQRSGQSALFVGRSDVTEGISSSRQLRRHHYCNTDTEVLGVCRNVSGCYSLSVLQFCSLSQTPESGTQFHLQQMEDRLKQMCVLFVGPLPANYTHKKIHMLLCRYGNLRSIRLLKKTHTLYAVVEFEQPEGAQLTLQSLNNQQIHHTTIKVQRPVSESTLDLQVSLAELQDDVLNDGEVYVGGLSLQHHDKLLQAFSPFGPIHDITTPAKNSGKQWRPARIKFVNPESVSAVLGSQVQMENRTLSVCRALTPPHMQTWTHTCPSATERDGETFSLGTQVGKEKAVPAEHTCPQDVLMESLITQMDRNIKKVFKSLQENTLSIVLLPGTISGGVKYSGLCFIEIKKR
ncbi:RNA exonuclease 5-like isoform X1 [Hoplias malabaricus]|uniref:RNA exonuclease 5-like isoform X1 n=1 Tax=Hoplias malabaricus TaxID=27720 RepID=UPI003461981A